MVVRQGSDRGQLTIRGRSFRWGERTYLMGVLNVTPDSFSDGGEFNSVEAALARSQHLIEAGADILDIGGQSTRPGAEQIALDEELNRVLPIVEAVRSISDVPISVDTTRALVAQKAVEVGVDLINDISSGTFDPEMLPTVAQLGVPIVLMHMRGTPQTMQQLTAYDDLMGEIYAFLERQMAAAVAVGMARSHLIVDPGIGFAKTAQHNWEILRKLPTLHSLDAPMLVGVSRKSFIGRLLDRPDPKQRVWGTGAACCGAIAGGADIIRVHDVREMHDVCRVADAIWRGDR